MKIMKFGGTSVGSPQRIKDVAALITESGNKVFVVLSAMSGTTNSLLEFSDYLHKNNSDAALDIIRNLEVTYINHVKELYSSDKLKKLTVAFIKDTFRYLRSIAHERFNEREEKIVVAHGEILSTNMVTNYLQETGVKVHLLPALDFMKLDENNEPDKKYIREHLANLLNNFEDDTQVFITQGFICRNANGDIDNLQRGGSDYTASLIGAAIMAEEIQIWTDIDGMHNNDPRFVQGTTPVHQLNFEEAAELAYFGAKILHPTCVLPAKYASIPLKLLNTMEPNTEGTTINSEIERGKFKAIAAKDNITAIGIKSSRMFLASGFLCKVFETFAKYNTPIDMICTSEVGVSLTIDNDAHLANIVEKLKEFGSVTVDKNLTIICVVGDLDWHNIGFENQATYALRDIPVRMISYGGSNHNISFLVQEKDKVKALNNLMMLF